jgi:hypothetical protein
MRASKAAGRALRFGFVFQDPPQKAQILAAADDGDKQTRPALLRINPSLLQSAKNKITNMSDQQTHVSHKQYKRIQHQRPENNLSHDQQKGFAGGGS